MAPMAPLGKSAAIKIVNKGRLPCSFGSPHPHVAIVEQDGKFRIRALVVDPAEEAEAYAKSGGYWMPEHVYALGRPTGKIFVEAESRAELITKIKAMAWPDDW